jgi:AcrR family transcriptional regulator
VIEQAVEIAASRGSEALSIRSLAAELNVSPMALYRHVANKTDLLDEVVNRFFADRWEPDAPRQDWRAWLIEAADRLRGFLVEQPAALHVYLRRPVLTSTSVHRMQACVDVLQVALGDEERARNGYAAVQTYTIGFAALEAARASSPYSARKQSASALGRELASYTSPERFRAGLELLIAGMTASA